MPLIQPWWTPRYALNKMSRFMYEKRHYDYPWLNRHAITLLSSLIKTSDIGLELGSGRSTIWLARHMKLLTSVEHDVTWYERISKQLKEACMTNVTYLLVEDEHTYLGSLDRFSDGSLNFALVDGGARSALAIGLIDKLDCGGILVIDDAHKHLPCKSYSPKARTKGMGPSRNQHWESLSEGLTWRDFLYRVSSWRSIWTSDGVTDAGIWIKR